MYTVTKQSCINEITSTHSAFLVGGFVACLFGTLHVWLAEADWWWLVFTIVLSVALLLSTLFLTRKQVKRIASGSYYLQQDVLLRVEELYPTLNRLTVHKHGPRYDYELTFSRSGVLRITLFDKTEPEEFDADYAAVFFSQPGDSFYVVHTVGKKERVIKCFPAKYYSVSEKEFRRDGDVYYPTESTPT